MKKLVLFLAGLLVFTALHAQWVDDPINNTFIANCGNNDGEVYLSTNTNTGDTYVQWEGSASNGWSPTLQRLNFEGVPQWGNDGIHIGGHEFSSMSEGVAMTTTTDGCVVSCFATYDGFTYAVKIDPDGNFVWGEQGLQLFGGLGFSRTELTAGDDGGFWALGFDYTNLYLQYVGADGTLGPTTTISDSGGYKCMFGQLTLSIDNNVLLTYEKVGSGFYTDKELYVIAVTPEGGIISPDQLLMSSQTFQSTYIHKAIADGMGGGYAYIWHPGIGGAFNTYVFHFNEIGFSTINDQNGISVHSTDPMNYYGYAYGAVDPVSHDLIVAYEQTDASTQSQSRLYVNRITATGERIWGEGILLADYVGVSYADIMVDAFEDGSGFSVIYTKSSPSNSYFTTIEAMGVDMNGNQLWAKTLCSNVYRRTVCDNTPGFIMGQNIVTWVNCIDGGIYGQNIGPDGTMGPIEPPVITCFPPENLEGEYVYDMEEQLFGVKISWIAPETQPLHYNLYRYSEIYKDQVIIEVEADATSYFDECGLGQYTYQLTAVYEHCESEFALTPEGEDFVQIEVTGIEENVDNRIINVLNVYNMKGQRISANHMSELNTGVYILQGLTEDGRLVSQKVMVDKK
ncbi:MAG: T9SS type A sorting domain-containing protein [Bacteroidales bacterium]|nr:T9SS type A sorting domain-containing protein [Bacteroidales bacterium]